MTNEVQAHDDVTAYTLSLGDDAFVHQHVVDAWTAQHAESTTPPTRLFFALVGLYLHVEHGVTGRAVQQAHAALARRPEAWPLPPLPPTRGAVTVLDVAATPPGPARITRISEWVASVWAPYATHGKAVETLLKSRGLI